MDSMIYDSRPPADELAAWFLDQPPEQREFFASRGELVIPFAWYGGFPRPFAEAALGNGEVQENIRTAPDVWREESIRRAPPMRWEFEFVIAFGGMEVMRWSKNKSGWGKLLWIAPLQADDPCHPMFLECVHKPESKFRKGLEQRRWMKRKLGKRHAPLVGKARTYTKADFVHEVENAAAKFAETMIEKAAGKPGAVVLFPEDSLSMIRRRLQMTPGEFWQHARGKELPAERMIERVQLGFSFKD